MKPVFRTLLATVFALALVASAACGASSTSSSSSKSSTSKSSGSSTSGGGTKTGGGLDSSVSAPKDFPSDFPTYPGSRLTTAFASSSGSSLGWVMQWETLDSPDKVNTYMVAHLGQGDWNVSGQFSSSGSFLISFNRKSDTKFAGTMTIDTNKQKNFTEIGLLMGNGK